jgi:hypothetical protein
MILNKCEDLSAKMICLTSQRWRAPPEKWHLQLTLVERSPSLRIVEERNSSSLIYNFFNSLELLHLFKTSSIIQNFFNWINFYKHFNFF